MTTAKLHIIHSLTTLLSNLHIYKLYWQQLGATSQQFNNILTAANKDEVFVAEERINKVLLKQIPFLSTTQWRQSTEVWVHHVFCQNNILFTTRKANNNDQNVAALYQTGRVFLVLQRAAWPEDADCQAHVAVTHLSCHPASSVSEETAACEENQTHLPPTHLQTQQHSKTLFCRDKLTRGLITKKS